MHKLIFALLLTCTAFACASTQAAADKPKADSKSGGKTRAHRRRPL